MKKHKRLFNLYPQHVCFAYLVGLVVILWVVFENLLLLLIIEVANQIIQTKFLSPLLGVDKPARLISVLL